MSGTTLVRKAGGKSNGDELADPLPAETEQETISSAPPVRPRGLLRRLFRLVLVLALLAGAATGGAWWYQQSLRFEDTDDAFIDGRVVQVSPRITGHVLKVLVSDNQHVDAGALLLEIDPRDYQVRVDQARAAVESAKARLEWTRTDLDLTRKTAPAAVEQERQAVASAEASLVAAKAEAERAAADLKRHQALFQTGGTTQAQLDLYATAARATEAAQVAAEKRISEAKAKLQATDVAGEKIAKAESDLVRATSDLTAAQSALEQAELNLSYTKVHAAQAGTATKRSVEAGNFVQPGQALLGLVVDEKWVLANFKETQLEHIRPGQRVDIHIDAYPHLAFKGHIDSIQRGTGARFSLLPAENATGNYVKLVQRVPVKIVFDEPPPQDVTLSLGMSVVPKVSIR